ncbi:hypothetical protein BJ741DRAFT_419988 [Chytriomyces cf. hyalinus JEL632]|nr:hypothetical protein BJ741DRAFT_419988 [Chytriomyces cf. hyalinus JEL632]
MKTRRSHANFSAAVQSLLEKSELDSLPLNVSLFFITQKSVQNLSTFDPPRVRSAPPAQLQQSTPKPVTPKRQASPAPVAAKLTTPNPQPAAVAADEPISSSPAKVPANPAQTAAIPASIAEDESASIASVAPTANLPPQVAQFQIPQHGVLHPMMMSQQQMGHAMYMHAPQGYMPYQQGGFTSRPGGSSSHGRPPSGPGGNQFGGKGAYKGVPYQQNMPQGAQHMPVMTQPGQVPMFYPYPPYQGSYGNGYEQHQPQQYYYQQQQQQQQQQLYNQVPYVRPPVQAGVPPMTPLGQPARFSQPPSPGGTIPPPSSAPFPPTTPSQVPLIQTPVKKSAIRITNPLTKEEVKLPASDIKSTTTTPVPSAGIFSVPSTPSPAPNTPIPSLSTSAVLTPSKGESALGAAPSSAIRITAPGSAVKEKPSIVLKDPQGHVISFVKSSKAPDGVETVLQSAPVAVPSVPVSTPATEAVVPAKRGKSPDAKRAASPKPSASVEKPQAAASVPTDSVAKSTSRSASPAAGKSASRSASPSRTPAAVTEKEAPVATKKSTSRPASPSRAPEEPKPVEAVVAKAVKSPVASPRLMDSEMKRNESPSREDSTASSSLPPPGLGYSGPARTGSAASAASPRSTATPPAVVAVLKYECRLLDTFENQVYPEGVTRPQSTPILKYSLDFMMLMKDFAVPPPGLTEKTAVLQDEASGAQRRNTNPRQGSYGQQQAGPPQKQGSMRGPYPGVKGAVMPTVPAPAGVGRMASRNAGYNQRMGSQEGGGKRNQRGPGGGRNNSMPQHNPNEPPVEAIKTTENGWTPDTLKKKKVIYENEEAAKEAHDAEVCKKVKGLLNKLTIEKFDSISNNFLELPITNPILLKKIIDIVYDKAVDEAFFQNMYGRLCQKLSSELPKKHTWIDMDSKNNIFRRLLLNKCQEEYESSAKWTKEDNAGEESRQERVKRLNDMSSEEKEKYALDQFERGKVKRRVLGNMTFIGELFKLNMITEKIMHMCMHALLDEVTNPEEEEVECTCKLMMTIGERLDHEKVKQTMDVYFNRIKALSINVKLSSRIRFMLQDLIDLRKNKWKGRQEVAGPLTIAEIHAIAAKKQKEEEAARARTGGGGGGRGGGGGGRGGGGRGGRDRDDRRDNRDSRHNDHQQYQGQRGGQDRQPSGRTGQQDIRQQVSADGWSTVEKGKGREDNFSNFGKADVRRPVAEIRLGPPSSAWGKGAGATTNTATGAAKKEEKRLPSNSFSILSGGDKNEAIKSPVAAEAEEVETSGLSKEVAERKMKAMVAEWFNILDVNEVIASQKELITDEYNTQLLSLFITESFNVKAALLPKTANLLCDLVEAGAVSSDELLASFTEVAEMLDDLAIDIPGVHGSFAVYYGAAMLADDATFSLSALVGVFGESIESPMKKPPVPQALAQIFKFIRSTKDEATLIEIFDRQMFDVLLFWPSSKRSTKALREWKEAHELNCLATVVPAFIAELSSQLEERDIDAAVSHIRESHKEAVRSSPAFVLDVALSVLFVVGSLTVFENGVDAPLEHTRELFSKQEQLIAEHKPLFDLCLEGTRDRQALEFEVLVGCQIHWSETGQVKNYLEHLFRIFTKLEIVDASTEDAWAADLEREKASKSQALTELETYLLSR